jgi:tetratricopeptide (TPR) repeat protein
MRERFQAFVLFTALAAFAVVPAAAQVAPLEPPTGDPPKLIEPPAPENLPKPPQQGDPRQNLDKLFEALKIAPSDDSAKYFENRIWALWLAGGGDTANLLMGRVKTAMDARDLDLAIRLLNAVIDIRPDYVEGWNRRATVYYMKKDYGNALADIREVLAREPRHFGALSGLGMIMQDIGDDKHALEAFQRALAVHPHLERIPDLVKRLRQSVEGRDI